MDNTGIEWTDATWNPLTGCTKVSAGCDHCYAETIAHRFAGTKAYPNGFEVTLRPERLDQPLRWKRPRRIFVNSMADLFHDDVPDRHIAEVWAVMSLAPHHTFQLLTKRHARMRALVSSSRFRLMVNAHRMRRGYAVLPDSRQADGTYAWPLPNVWLGVSVENQQWADIRIPALLDTPAAVRWISAEPLLGPINLYARNDEQNLNWVVVGGESGHGARPMNPDWARALRDQCANHSVPFLFKQWGEWGPAPWYVPRTDGETDADWKARAKATAATHAYPFAAHIYNHMTIEAGHKPWSLERDPSGDIGGHAAIRRWGKKAAGRELDGRTWDEYPATVTA